ncbi:uncharacterized protein LOC117341023 [Pecten maximus]|uniref:uncharacterized protein LOC117341023 n=1 Tax=Pecten maximus TaxID=6579 RepID=UPI0014580FD6|nr:uncharacterized protein LOC117341023 [Pecten maximus]XP_033758722.1 uncharacterized protein LOC117341023 [Pecten maximus]XP_033758723.1 uncharacterized protein LOC117341023 [Pecten maximus]
MEPSQQLRPKSAKHNYHNRPPQPKPPKSRDPQIPYPVKSTEAEKTRLEPDRPKSAHPRAKSRHGIVVDIVNSHNSIYTDITVITDGRNTRVPSNLQKPVKSNLKRSKQKKHLNEIGQGKMPATKMATDNMKENSANVKMVAHQVTQKAETITRCYYRPLTPIITNEDEYYAKLDPVDYFNDPTIQDLPMLKEKSKTTGKNQMHSMQLPTMKSPPHDDGKSNPWSGRLKDPNKTLVARKKYVNTKNSVYAMFFDDRPGTLISDTKKHVRPLTDDKVIMQSTKTLQNGGLVGNALGVKKSRLTKVDGRRLIGYRGNNTRGPPGSEKSWIPRYNGLSQNTHTLTTVGKTGSPNVKIAQGLAARDPKTKYRYELRPFSEGVNILADNELLRYRANHELYHSKYNVDRLLAKHKKKCGNFPNGFDLKPRRNNLVGPDQLEVKHPGTINGHQTPRPRKLKPIPGVHKT